MSQPEAQNKNEPNAVFRNRRRTRRSQPGTDDIGDGAETWASDCPGAAGSGGPTAGRIGSRRRPPSWRKILGGDTEHRYKILIGKDTRLSGYMLETALASGICSMGADVLLVGSDADAGRGFSDPQHERRRRRGDFGFAQSLSR